jgi:hypothetical protein
MPNSGTEQFFTGTRPKTDLEKKSRPVRFSPVRLSVRTEDTDFSVRIPKKNISFYYAAIQEIEKIVNTFFGESEGRKKHPLRSIARG